MFETCSSEWYEGEDGCKDLAEINEWIKDKHLVALQNQQIFTQNYEDPIKNVASISRFQLFRNEKVEYPIRIQMQHLELSDSILSIGAF